MIVITSWFNSLDSKLHRWCSSGISTARFFILSRSIIIPVSITSFTFSRWQDAQVEDFFYPVKNLHGAGRCTWSFTCIDEHTKASRSFLVVSSYCLIKTQDNHFLFLPIILYMIRGYPLMVNTYVFILIPSSYVIFVALDKESLLMLSSDKHRIGNLPCHTISGLGEKSSNEESPGNVNRALQKH